MNRLLNASAFLMAVVGCGGDRNESVVSVRDSAGVQIVVSAQPSWPVGQAWHLSPEPTLSIGEVEGDSASQFQQVVGVVRLSDSSVVVADAGSNSIRSFDRGGRLIRTFGRSGEGPGEFRALQSLRRFGTDSLIVLDRRLSRVTIFDRAGAVAGLVQLPDRFVSVYSLAQRKWLAAEEEGFFGGRLREDASAGLHRFPSAVVVLDPSGSEVDTVGAFPGAEMAYFQTGSRMGAFQAVYGRVLALGALNDEIYVGTGDELGYEVFSSSGQHLRKVRADGPDRTLRASDVSEFHAKLLAEIGNPAVRERFAINLKAAAVPEQKAAYTRLLVDPLRHVWLSDYENSYVATGIWRVFDREGRYLGEVQSPAQLRILEVGEHYVAGVWKGDLGVESVRLYALNR